MDPYIVLKKIGSNSYEFAILHNLGINPVFNVEDLTLNRAPFDYPTVIPDLPSSTFLEHRPFPIHTPPSRGSIALTRLNIFWMIRSFRLLMADICIFWCGDVDVHIHIVLSCAPRRSSNSTWICLMSMTFAIH